jgi:hypothetical protein
MSRYSSATPAPVYDLIGLCANCVDERDSAAEREVLHILCQHGPPGSSLATFYVEEGPARAARPRYVKHTFLQVHGRFYNPIAFGADIVRLWTLAELAPQTCQVVVQSPRHQLQQLSAATEQQRLIQIVTADLQEQSPLQSALFVRNFKADLRYAFQPVALQLWTRVLTPLLPLLPLAQLAIDLAEELLHPLVVDVDVASTLVLLECC